MAEPRSRLKLIGPPGTNKIMAGELSRLVRRALPGTRLPAPAKQGSGAIVVPFSAALAQLVVHFHRTSSRVVWELFASTASRLEPLYDDLRRQMPGPAGWLTDGATISVRARNVGAFAAGERQIVGTVKNAIVDGAAERKVRLGVAPDTPDILIDVRMHDHELSVGIDLAGGAMNKRGYRQAGGAAPLRENLAAALVMLARHDSRREVLLDPMAGSATIAIEAALMGRGAPLWPPSRQPACAALPVFADCDPGPRSALFADTEARAVANELVPATAAAARANAAAAGVADLVRIRTGDFRDLRPSDVSGEPGLILCNPPYGERLSGEDVRFLYRDLREWLAEYRGWRAGFLVANPEFEGLMKMRPRVKKPLSARPFRGYFYLYELW
jgi:23S rRNA G2445 N2-methylase RlmL